jgi:hypothetical protein
MVYSFLRQEEKARAENLQQEIEELRASEAETVNPNKKRPAVVYDAMQTSLRLRDGVTSRCASHAHSGTRTGRH